MKTKPIRRREWKTQLKKLSLITLFCMMPVHCSARPPVADKAHHTDDGFRNVHEFEEKGFLDFLKWRWERSFKEIPGTDDYDFTPASNDPDFLKTNRSTHTVTWIGHATVLVQMAGQNILTDPHFSKRASPVQWAGPERVIAPGIAMERLPAIDMVVISHDHYDALDEQSIVDLHARPGGDRTQFLVPLGLKAWFLERGIQRVVELDWWEAYEVPPIEVMAVPVQHWGKRSLFSRNQNLWAGWAVLSPGFRFFFAGDTGYCPHFKAIGERLGPFDLAAIPIGAYEPRWFMRNYHVNPEEAVQIHFDIGSRKSVAIHWGTFILTDEPLDEPPQRLKKALSDQDLSQDEFMVLKHGETVVLN